MKKEKLDEKQLLADAKQWFEQTHGKTPKECGIKFIKVWYKPIPFKKMPTVVFAPTEEIGKAFIWEQNAILRAIRYFWIAPVSFLFFMFLIFSRETKEEAIGVAIIFTVIVLFALIFFLYLGRKAQKLEKIHQWDVELYHL